MSPPPVLHKGCNCHLCVRFSYLLQFVIRTPPSTSAKIQAVAWGNTKQVSGTAPQQDRARDWTAAGTGIQTIVIGHETIDAHHLHVRIEIQNIDRERSVPGRVGQDFWLVELDEHASVDGKARSPP